MPVDNLNRPEPSSPLNSPPALTMALSASLRTSPADWRNSILKLQSLISENCPGLFVSSTWVPNKKMGLNILLLHLICKNFGMPAFLFHSYFQSRLTTQTRPFLRLWLLHHLLRRLTLTMRLLSFCYIFFASV
jgi:hypothetical protein